LRGAFAKWFGFVVIQILVSLVEYRRSIRRMPGVIPYDEYPPKSREPDVLQLFYEFGNEPVTGRIDWSRDGGAIAAPIDSGVIQIWNPLIRQLLRSLPLHQKCRAYSITWGEKRNSLACACSDSTVRIFEMTEGDYEVALLRGHDNEVRSVCWSPSQPILASGGIDGTVRLWDAKTGKSLDILKCAEHYINSVNWSPNGRKLVAADGGGFIHIWNFDKDQYQRLTGHESFVVSVVWSNDGSLLVSGSYDGTVRIWNPSGGPPRVLAGHRGPVVCVSLSAKGERVASKSHDGTVRVWATAEGQLVDVFTEAMPEDWAPGLSFHPTHPVLATLGKDLRGIRIWAPQGFYPVRQLRPFLCHAVGDKPKVLELYDRLVADRFAPWLDSKCLLPGQDWRSEIERAVRTSDTVIVLLSNQSVSKEGFVQKEITMALDVAEEKPEGTIFIIPARLEPCEVPRRLQRWQWVDLFGSSGYSALINALRSRSTSLGIGTN